jgi:DNA-directed RNA polymerase subunit omega
MSDRDNNDVLALHNKYSLVKGVARRARQLQSGAMPLVPPTSMKACRVAQDEFRNGHVRYVVPPMSKLIIPPTL